MKRTRNVHYRGRDVVVPFVDSRRQRIYEAEKRVFGEVYEAYAIGTGSDAQRYKTVEAFIRRVTDGGVFKWSMTKFMGHFPRHTMPKVFRGRSNAAAWGSTHAVSLPLWALNAPIVLHELAHYAVPQVAHHWPWAETYLDLVRIYMGTTWADRLRYEFDKDGIPYREPRKRKVTA